MKIVSKFKDYYDGVGANDLEPTPVYVREKREAVIDNNFAVDAIKRPRAILRSQYHQPGIKVEVTAGVVGFCGEIYPYILKERYGDVGYHKIGFQYEYDQSKFANMLWPTGKNIKPLLKWKWGMRDKKNLMIWLENIKKLKSIFMDCETPAFALLGITETGKIRIEINPRLADHYFYKAMDSYSAYQEISMFLGNELAKEKEVDVPVGGDEIVAHSKGYNKWSFRKEPGQKKRRNNK